LTELSPTLYAEEAIDLTHNSNGVAIAAHVGKTNSISLRRLGELKSLDGIEEFNPAAGLFNPTIADKFGKAETGGSDSHWKVSIGVAQTLFPEKDKILSYKPNLKKVLEEIVECIRKKRTESYYLPLTFFEYSVDKLRWLSSFYSFKSIVEFFNDKEKIIAKNIEKSLIE
jgi:predicted metal-dependent phosphoesterase TrpH